MFMMSFLSDELQTNYISGGTGIYINKWKLLVCQYSIVQVKSMVRATKNCTFLDLIFLVQVSL